MFDSCHGRLQLGGLYSDVVVVSCQLVLRLPGSVYRQLSFLGESGRVPATDRVNIIITLLEIVHFRLSYDAVY